MKIIIRPEEIELTAPEDYEEMTGDDLHEWCKDQINNQIAQVKSFSLKLP